MRGGPAVAGSGRRRAMPIRSASLKSTIHFMPSSMANVSWSCATVT